ncbi:MAG: type II toxin-antitoxin system VapC family toxin [Terriglobales bacterium]
MFLVDTNLLVYAADQNAPEHESARSHVSGWRTGREAWRASWTVFYEFLRVTTHPAVFSRPLSIQSAWSFLQTLAASPSFAMLGETDRHAEVVSLLVRRYGHVRGNHVHDFHIAAVMYENGVNEIRTADADFHRFDFLTVVNPLSP